MAQWILLEQSNIKLRVFVNWTSTKTEALVKTFFKIKRPAWK
jgi:hypothetical protein